MDYKAIINEQINRLKTYQGEIVKAGEIEKAAQEQERQIGGQACQI